MIYKLYTDYVVVEDPQQQVLQAKQEQPPEHKSHTKNKGKTHKSKGKSAEAPTQTWTDFETNLQTFLDGLALEYVSVTVTGSPSLVAAQGGPPGKYLVCQAVMCSKKLT